MFPSLECFMLDRFLFYLGQRVPERGDRQRAVFLCVLGLTGFHLGL